MVGGGLGTQPKTSTGAGGDCQSLPAVATPCPPAADLLASVEESLSLRLCPELLHQPLPQLLDGGQLAQAVHAGALPPVHRAHLYPHLPLCLPVLFGCLVLALGRTYARWRGALLQGIRDCRQNRARTVRRAGSVCACSKLLVVLFCRVVVNKWKTSLHNSNIWESNIGKLKIQNTQNNICQCITS